jgi:hypothetical protein
MSENLETIKSLDDAFFANELDRAVQLVAEDMVWDRRLPSWGTPF